MVIFEPDMIFHSLSKTKAKELKALSTKKERDRQGLFIVEGEKCVVDTLDAFELENLLVTPEWIENHSVLSRRYKDKILSTDHRGIEIVSSLSSLPSVIAIYKIPEVPNQIPLLKKNKIYVLLDEIQDPGNLGTIIRTCDWYGVYEIFASKTTVDVFSPKVVQATMGSLSRVRVTYTDLEQLISKNPEIKVIGTLLNGTPLNEIKSLSGGMILLGNEGRGISDKLKKLIDLALTIPPINPESHPDSLNVAISNAIILSHLIPYPKH